MINFKFLLGLFPKTETIEAKEAALIKEYSELEAYKTSEELARYFELKKLVEAPEFKQKEQEIAALAYQGTDAQKKETEYLSLKKSARIVNYYKVLNSVQYKNFEQVKPSAELKEYDELREFTASDAFKSKMAELKVLDYKSSEACKQELEYKALQKSPLVKNYFKVEAGEAYKNYTHEHGSEDLKHFEELKAFAEDQKIIELQKNIKSAKFNATPEFEKLQQYTALSKLASLNSYKKIVSSEAYRIFKDLDGSAEIEQYKKLESFIVSDKFAEAKQNKETWKDSESAAKEAEFEALKKDKKFKTYFTFILSKEFSIVQEVEKSGDLAKFSDLEKYVKSEEFLKVQQYYKLSPDKRWQEQPEYQKVNEYNILSKDPRFVQYFKFIASKEFSLFNEAVSSGTIDKFKELKEITEGEAFKNKKQYLLLPFAKKWEQTDEHVKEEAYKKLAALQTIKDYLKFIATKEYKLFDEVSKGEEVGHYEELEKYINSEEFKDYKKYMLLKFKDKWALTEEFKNNQEYQLLVKSEKVKWYHKVVESPKFDEIKAWKLTFADDFEGEKINPENWLTRFYWGDNLLHDSYSMIDDRHFNTDGKNVSISNSILRIETRQEKVMGKAWNPMFGFMPREFDYTSGLVNTGKSFRQQYGRFRAKIKMGQNGLVTNAFWMVGNQILPHVDIVKFVKNKFWMGNLWGNITEANGIQKQVDYLSAGKLHSGYYIYELEWNENELIWRINGLELKRVTTGVPNEPMYIQLSTGIMQDANGQHFPSSMEIDWVKCYEKA